MNTGLIGLWALFLTTPPPTETQLQQLAPVVHSVSAAAPVERRAGMGRAVVLLHGLRPQPWSASSAARAEPSYWEQPHRTIVTSLAKESDVFAFHYGQTAPVDDVARSPDLIHSVRALREAGYIEVVFVGYSAGALIARQFVEDQPGGGGVNKVIQICAPNGGSGWTSLALGVREVQTPFVKSLTKSARAAARHNRADRRIPAEVEFVCVVGQCNWIGDGVVRRDSQWTPELQEQGIPADTIFLPHVGAMYSARLSAKVADLVRTPQRRWSKDEVAAAREKVLGKALSAKAD